MTAAAIRLQRILTAAERRLEGMARSRLERRVAAADRTLDAVLDDPVAAPETAAGAESAFQAAYDAYFAAAGRAWWPDTVADGARHEARPGTEAEAGLQADI
jgi:hypothetical protein